MSVLLKSWIGWVAFLEDSFASSLPCKNSLWVPVGHLREEFLGEQANSPWRQFWAGPYLDLPHFYEDYVILPYQRVLEIESDRCPRTAAAPFLARPLDTTVLRDPAVSSRERPEQPGSWPEISPGSLRSLWSWCLLVGVYGVQPVSFVWLFVTPWTAAHQASLSFIIPWSLLKLMSIELVMPSNHLILCCPLLLLPSVFPSIRVFSDELSLPLRWPKYWSFSFNISPSNEYSGLISFRMDWLDLLASQWASQESSPTPQFESIISSVLSFLCGPVLTSIHDYWKNHSFD